MQKYTDHIIFNKKKLQPINSNSCGEYCIFFASMRSRDVNFKEIIKYMYKEKNVLDYVNDLTSSY